MKTHAMTISDVDAAAEAHEFKVGDYLRSRGWTSTCSNPASLWLWERAMPDGRVLLTDKTTALAFERCTFTGDDTGGEG